jgi:hypothetical protein
VTPVTNQIFFGRVSQLAGFAMPTEIKRLSEMIRFVFSPAGPAIQAIDEQDDEASVTGL